MLTGAGAVLGERYALERRLAAGGMGEVWCAEDRLLGRPVAVKLPHPELRADPGFADRLLAEARHAAAVRHRGIAEVYDVHAADPTPYLVMELVDGVPLSAVIQAEAPLPAARVRRLVCQVAEALGAAHAAGLVHRDVKPSNLLVTDGDVVKITDFGIARAADSDSLTRTGFVVGTAQYLSPEQAGGRPASAASDMYALGVVTYELLTGHRPFEGGALAVLHAHREADVPPLPRTVPADLRDLVMRLLHKDPARRPTAAQVVGGEPRPAERTAVLDLAALRAGVADRPRGANGADGPRTAPHALPDTALPDTARHRLAELGEQLPPQARHSRRRTPGRPGQVRGALPDLSSDRSGDARRPVVALAGAAAAVLALVAAVGLLGNDGGTAPQDVAAPAPSEPVVQPVAAVSLFHPGGSRGDNPEEVDRVVDGDPTTIWTTQRYDTPQFGNLRPGVGLLFDLGEPREVREVRLTLPRPGLSLQVHAGEAPGDALLDTPPLGSVAEAPQSTVLPLSEPTTARYWVVWIDRLPAAAPHRAAVAEAAFVG